MLNYNYFKISYSTCRMIGWPTSHDPNRSRIQKRMMRDNCFAKLLNCHRAKRFQHRLPRYSRQPTASPPLLETDTRQQSAHCSLLQHQILQFALMLEVDLGFLSQWKDLEMAT